MTRSKSRAAKASVGGARTAQPSMGEPSARHEASDRPAVELAGLRRRLASMLYESMLLLGVLALTFLVPYLMLGIGARMAYGCNIGAFFSGVASSSLHGWVWIVGALAGNWIGTQFRPTFGLPK